MTVVDKSKDRLLVKELERKPQPHLHVVEEVIRMGANVDTTGSNCLSLCIEQISGGRETFQMFEIIQLLLKHNISKKRRLDAIKSARKRQRKCELEYESDCNKKSALQTVISLIENAPFHYEEPMELVPVSTKKALSSLLFSEKYSDVTFVFKTCVGKDGGESNSENHHLSHHNILHAHRSILAASSPYFDAYFGGEWGGENPVFETTNSLETMKVVLKYIYTGEVPPADCLIEYATELFKVASEYEVEGLIPLAANRITKNLTLENVKEVFHLSDVYNCKDLKRGCGIFVFRQSPQAMFHEDLCALKQEKPELWKELQSYVDAAATSTG